MKIPVLVYHSMRIHGNSYADNDLVAFSSDLEQIAASGLRIIPLRELVRIHRNGIRGGYREKLVALTCDDGGDFDFHDLPHPSAGYQRSVFNRLGDYQRMHPEATPHITSFVIVSPEARKELDQTCMIGRGWWNDAWWPLAAGSGLMDIANHSWDHNHDALPERFFHGVPRGSFKHIATQDLADRQIRAANEYLRRRAPNPGTRLFAYPYGECNAYLAEEYFPKFAAEIGIDAAFGAEPTYVRADSLIWNLPRFICGHDWKTPAEFGKILHGAAGIAD